MRRVEGSTGKRREDWDWSVEVMSSELRKEVRVQLGPARQGKTSPLTQEVAVALLALEVLPADPVGVCDEKIGPS